MSKEARIILRLILGATYAAGFSFFYYVYVPLIPSFQIVLVPLFLLTFVLTLARIEWGVLGFVFAYPLVNNIPYFFGIDEHFPHAPVALVLFLVFLGGWLVKKSLAGSPVVFPPSVAAPVVLLGSIVAVSAVLTFWRYSEYFPILSSRISERIVNVNLVRAGGAIMSDVFNSLNYLTGLAFLIILWDSLRSRDQIRRVLIVFSLSAAVSLAFSLVQRFTSPLFGNTKGWVALGQINSTFQDPNAFGAFLSAGVPVFLGLALGERKRARVALWLMIILAVFVFPSAGSRSPLLAIIASLGLFGMLIAPGGETRSGKRTSRSLVALVLLILVTLSLVLFFSHTTLTERLKLNLANLSHKDAFDRISGGKGTVWTVAALMIRDFPLTGVGMGAYIIELPNYLQTLGRPSSQTDSAENIFLQAGAELGVIGLGLFLWIFVAVIQRMRSTWGECRSPDKDRFVRAGILAGLLSLAVNFLFHSYIGSFDVTYTFWLLVALVFAWSSLGRERTRPSAVPARRRWAPVLLVGIFGLLHLWNSSHSLSLVNETERYGWSQNFGLYDQEKDERGFSFRWTRKSAGLTIECLGPTLVLPLKVSHPDIGKHPVTAKVYLGDRHLRKKTLLKEKVFTNTDWQDFEYSPPSTSRKIYLILETDRDWNPSRSLRVPDRRSLALALGEYWFNYPAELAGQKPTVLQTYSPGSWEGDLRDNLYTNGTSRMPIRLERANLAIRLWVKGTRALGLGPMITIRLDGRPIGKTMVMASDWTPLIMMPEAEPAAHMLSVEFTNDFFSGEAPSQDRNLALGNLEIISLE